VKGLAKGLRRLAAGFFAALKRHSE